MHPALSPAPTYCVLTVITRLLVLAVQVQLSNLLRGHRELVTEMDALGRLLYTCRAGVCTETAVLPRNELPDLTVLLDQLPPSWQRQVVDAIVGEQAGHVCHAASFVPMLQPGEIARLPLPELVQPARDSSPARRSR
jgi:hypothetical protein